MSAKDFNLDPENDIDEDTFVKMQEREREEGRRGVVRSPSEPPLPLSKYTLETVKKTSDGKVLIRCVSHLKPWASQVQMDFWKDYLVTPEEAILMDRRRFCVILQPAQQPKQTKGVE